MIRAGFVSVILGIMIYGSAAEAQFAGEPSDPNDPADPQFFNFDFDVEEYFNRLFSRLEDRCTSWEEENSIEAEAGYYGFSYAGLLQVFCQ